MISIAIINLKGGVGKSVTACNLAAELAAKSKSVLVVDLDKQGNTSKFFGVLDYDSPSVAEVMLGEDDILAAIVKGVDVWGVHLLPCDMRMLKANRTILMDNGPRQFHLRDALKCVAGDYDYCIMDCPPDLDMGSINALCAADWVIIPVDCDKWACDGMQEIVEQIEQVQAYYNPRLKIMGARRTSSFNCARRESACWRPSYATPSRLARRRMRACRCWNTARTARRRWIIGS